MEGCSLHSGWVFLTQSFLLEMLSQTHSVDCFPSEPKSSQIDNKDISTPCPWYTNHSQMPHTCLEEVLQFLDIVLGNYFHHSFYCPTFWFLMSILTTSKSTNLSLALRKSSRHPFLTHNLLPFGSVLERLHLRLHFPSVLAFCVLLPSHRSL